MKRLSILLTACMVFLSFSAFAQEYHTIYEIQQVDVGDDASYMEGEVVMTSGIVTAGAGLFYAGSHISFYLQDNTGGPWSGILIFNDDNSAFATAIGDSVLVTGTVAEYRTFAGDSSRMTEIVTIGEPITIVPFRPLPEIMVIDCGVIDSTNGADSLAEQYEGCLVQVRDVMVSDISSPYAQFNVTDNLTGDCIIRMYSDSLQNFGTPSLGIPFESITGVIYSVYGNYTLMPRTAADLVLAEGPPIITGTNWSPGGHPWSDDTVSVYTNLSDDSWIEEASVFYRVNGGGWTDLVLEPQGEITYRALIPAQPDYSEVDFYVYAIDDEENEAFDPPDAPNDFYTYTVSDSIPTTIYEIQYTEDPEGASFFQYRNVVDITGIITADSSDFPVDSAASHQVLYIQDIDDPYSTGGAWNGIYVYNRNDDAAWMNCQRGDLVEISATVSEYYGLTELQDISGYNVLSSGNPLPDPVDVTCSDLMEGTATGEAYEGCLVKLTNVTVIDPAITDLLWSVTDASGDTCIIGGDGIYTYEPAAGAMLDFIVGVVRYSGTTFKVEPRNDDDLLASGVDDITLLTPYEFALNGNYPNPFNPVTNIEFSLRVKAPVKLEIFDLLGRQVITLIDGEMNAGPHTVQWNGAERSGAMVSSGVYFIRYSGEGFDFSDKIVLMK